ncbi:hypothetical protein HMPREF1039_0417 [Megasphaera lornae]|uniref:Uncharacterized protein n=1 Tax=Megasphaera lornae TaxID=1000568 RepID=A0ABN0CYJ5_9FIRM|nr:hypothetical protein HMPREF1039_0417 [Megasphaera lornae]
MYRTVPVLPYSISGNETLFFPNLFSVYAYPDDLTIFFMFFSYILAE